MPDKDSKKEEKKVNVVRPDGTVVQATPSEAKRLSIFGYRLESQEEGISRAEETVKDKYYSGTGQGALTVAEGLVSGATLGLADPLITTDETRERAARRPGLRIGSELVGAILPAVLSGGTSAEATAAETGAKIGGRLLAKTPAAVASRLGTGIAESVGGIKGAALGYGAEGAIVGAGSALTESELSGDPLTTASVFSHIGAGAFLGAGVGAAGEAVFTGASKLRSRLANETLDLSAPRVANEFDDTLSAFYKSLPAEKTAAKEAVPVWTREAKNVSDDYYEISKGLTTKYERDAAWKMVPDGQFDSFRSGLDDVFQSSKIATADVDLALKNAQAASKEFNRGLTSSAEDLGSAIRTVKAGAADTASTRAERAAISAEFTELEESYKVMRKALAEDDPIKAMNRIERFRQTMKENAYFQGSVGAALSPIKADVKAAQKIQQSLKAAEDAVKFKAVGAELSGFPKTQDEFFKMSSKRAEKLFAAMDVAEKNPEFRQGFAAIDQMMETAGIQMSGSAGTKARGLWEAGRKAEKPFVGREIPTARGKFEKMADLPGAGATTRQSFARPKGLDPEEYWPETLADGVLSKIPDEFKTWDRAFDSDVKSTVRGWVQRFYEQARADGIKISDLSGELKLTRLKYKDIIQRGDVAHDGSHLVESLSKNPDLPPIVVANKGGKNYVMDGHHRLRSYDAVGRDPLALVGKITPGGEPGLKFSVDLPRAAPPVPKAEWPEVLGSDSPTATVSGSRSVRGSRSGGGHAQTLWEKAARLGTSRYASAFAKKAGLGIAGSAVAYEVGGNLTSGLLGGGLVAGLAGAKAGIVSRLMNAVAKYGPATGKAIRRLAPRIEPLSVRIDGTIDAEHDKQDKRRSLKKRMDEIHAIGPSFRDTTFFAVQPLMARHPEFAKGIHDTANVAFQGLLQFLPKDPGMAYSRLKTLWKPTDIQISHAEKALAVYHDPVGSAEAILETGAADSVSVAALKTMYPPIYAELQGAMLNRLSDDGFLASLSYGDQARLSVLLNLPLHSSFSPRSIAQTQAMYATTKRPQNPSGSGAGSSSGGRPAKMEPPTASQSLLS